MLRELAEEYGGVAVSFPRTGTCSDNVTLKGPRECIDSAKKRIQEIVRDLVSFILNSCKHITCKCNFFTKNCILCCSAVFKRIDQKVLFIKDS